MRLVRSVFARVDHGSISCAVWRISIHLVAVVGNRASRQTHCQDRHRGARMCDQLIRSPQLHYAVAECGEPRTLRAGSPRGASNFSFGSARVSSWLRVATLKRRVFRCSASQLHAGRDCFDSLRAQHACPVQIRRRSRRDNNLRGQVAPER